MAEGGSNTGRMLAGGGCITFLLCFVCYVLFAFGFPIALGIMPELYDIPGVAFLPMLNYGCCCCGLLGGAGGLAGIVMILMGARSE